MANVNFSADVVINDQGFDKFVRQALVEQVLEFVSKLKPKIEIGAREYIAEAIQASPEWKSLLEVSSGERASLRVHLGLENPRPALDGILKAVQDGIVMETLPAVGDSLGGLCVRILPNDYAAELRVGGTEYPSNGYIIPWLKWLLVGGAGILVVESQMLYVGMKASHGRLQLPGSRTGPAIMITPKKVPSTGWRILPTEYSGTTDNNFLTRSLVDGRVGEKLISLFQKMISF